MLQKLLPNSAFARNVITLMTGTSIAQAIPIAISPILTRLYTPEDFGVVAVYMSCVAVLSIVSTGRYEMAITLPTDDCDAANIAVLSLKLCMAICSALLVIVIFAGVQIASILGISQLAPWLYFLPVSIMATSAINVFQFWCNRKSQYRRMSTNRVQSAALSSIANISFGIGGASGGMIFGGLLGQVFAAGWIGRTVLRENEDSFKNVASLGQKKIARLYSAHPKHVAPSHLIGTIAMQIPIFLISSVYSTVALGFFSLAYRLVSLPTVLIASAIGDVYRQKIAVAYNENGEFKAIFVKTLKTTTTLALLPFGILYFVVPDLFAIIFGEPWRVAGEYAQILIVSSFFQFIFTPIDKGALVVGATKYIYTWQVTRFIFSFLIFLVAKFNSIELQTILWLFVCSNCLLYITEGVVGFWLAKGRK